jgi:hypothetical protein
MASKQKRRVPRNVYTEERTEKEFQTFIQHSRSRNILIPEQLLSQATDDNRLSDPKRQRLAQEVCQTFLVYWVVSNLIFPVFLEPVRHKQSVNISMCRCPRC